MSKRKLLRGPYLTLEENGYANIMKSIRSCHWQIFHSILCKIQSKPQQVIGQQNFGKKALTDVIDVDTELITKQVKKFLP